MYSAISQRVIHYEYTLHARRRCREQAASPVEIFTTVEEGSLVEVRQNKGSRTHTFSAGYTQDGEDYPHKELKVVYAMENGKVVVVTLLTRFGKFE